MQTISANNQATSQQSSSLGSQSPGEAKDTTAAQTSDADNKATETKTVALSSRAQKIQQLNEEFFPSGPSSIKITPAFIERLKEYGLISEGEADRLGASASTDDKNKPRQLSELSQFIEDFSRQLEKKESEHNLIETLKQASNIIDQLDSAKPSDNSIKKVIAELNHYRLSEEGLSQSDADTSNFSQLESALIIADILSPAQVSSQKINHYLNIFHQT